MDAHDEIKIAGFSIIDSQSDFPNFSQLKTSLNTGGTKFAPDKGESMSKSCPWTWSTFDEDRMNKRVEFNFNIFINKDLSS